MSPTSNKSNADVDGGSSGATPRDLYEAGNPEASLNLLVENAIQRRRRQDSNKKIAKEDSSSDVRPPSAPFHTLQEEYNSSILTALMADPPTHDVTMFQDTLEPIEQAIFKSNETSTTTLKTEREQLIICHNKAVAFLASGDVHDAIEEAWKHLCPFLDTTTGSPTTAAAVKVPDELLRLACRLGFVLLDGLLMLWPQRRHNPEQVYKTSNGDDGGEDSPLLNIELIVTWLNDMVVEKELGDRDPQLKFLLSLYKSRADFHERDHSNKIPEANIRSARKELKQAMEVFQHKLRAVSNDSGSLASSSYSADDLHSGRSSGAKSPTPLSMSNSSGGGNNNNSSNMPRVLQHQNQAVLNLKANAEQLKGNTKKSLILCAEANNHDGEEGLDHGSNDEKNAYYEAIHQNNLGIVYETSGKPYLALHAFSKALRLSTSSSHDRQNGHIPATGASSAALFETNGTARPDLTLNILHNTGISSLKAGNYLGAYKCFAILLREGCNVWATRPRTWLRLAEACIGLANQQKKAKHVPKCAQLNVDERARGILIGDGAVFDDKVLDVEGDTSLEIFGTAEDLAEVQKRPLFRARLALEMATNQLASESSGIDFLLVSGRVSLSYVYLEMGDFNAALLHAERVLSCIAQLRNDSDIDIAQATLLKRQEATARMYACEASAMLGESTKSMKFIAGDGQKDAIDRLASDLAGVTLQTAATDARAKARLAKSSASVRCSASAASACLGNTSAAKQLALSAQAMENSYSISREKSSARKALLYSMLSEGNHGAALSLLRSAR